MMTITVKTVCGREVAVKFQRCGGLNDCLSLNFPSGKIVSIHRRQHRWVEAAVAGVVCRYVTHHTKEDAMRQAALDYVHETAYAAA